jgi:hypothetical protein
MITRYFALMYSSRNILTRVILGWLLLCADGEESQLQAGAGFSMATAAADDPHPHAAGCTMTLAPEQPQLGSGSLSLLNGTSRL